MELKTPEADSPKAPHRTARRRWMLSVAAATLAVAAVVGAAPAEEAPFDALTDIPLPRLNPQRVHTTGAVMSYTDPIADLLVDRIDDAHGTVKTGDVEPPTELETVVASRAQAPTLRSTSSGNSAGLRYAIKFIDDGNYAAATAASYAITDPVEAKIVHWLIVTSGDASVSSEVIADTWRRLSDWPGQALLQTRFEQALVREKPNSATVIRMMSGRQPITESGTMLLTRAYLDVGRTKDAAATIGGYWRNSTLR